MNTSQLIGTVFIFGSIIISIITMTFFVVYSKKNTLLKRFILTNTLLLIWLIIQVLELNLPDFVNSQSFLVLKLIPYCFIGVTWFFFCLELTNRVKFSMTKNIFIILPSTITYFIGATNKLHGLYYANTIDGHLTSQYNTFFWVNLTISYSFIILSVFILTQYFSKGNTNEKMQSIFLIIASLLPIGANILHVLKFFSLPFDLTSISFFIPILLFAIASYKYEFMDVIPSAFKSIIENVGEGIVVLDSQSKIVFINQTLSKLFNNTVEVKKNTSIEDFLKYIFDIPTMLTILDLINKSTVNNINHPFKKEFSVGNKELNLKIQPIINSKKDTLGTILIFSDITEYKKIQRYLEEYAEISQKLAIETERTRMARDIHDTVGHSMTLLISLLEVSKIKIHSEAEDASFKIDQAIQTAKEGLSELRKSVKGLKSHTEESLTVIDKINLLINRISTSGVSIDFSYNGELNDLVPDQQEAIFRTCQESITNSVRHGNATEITIILQAVDNKIQLYIIDNGVGCSNINKGFGLTSMEDRIVKIGGKIIIGSDGETGFNVRVEIPIERKSTS